MQIGSVGIIGYGDFGALTAVLIKRFAPRASVRVYSRKQESDGKTFFSLEDTCQCDAVVVCVPIANFEETIKRIVPLMPKTSILIDVCTVKVHTVEVLKKYAKGRPYIASHPMFGPQSYEKKSGGVDGFRIVLTAHTIPQKEYDAFVSFLRRSGFTVVETTPRKHDEHLAKTLFLTHFIGQIIKDAGFSRTEIDTVSFGFLMDAVDSVRNDTKLFQDVYRFNPYCKDVLDRFGISEKRVYDLLEKKRSAFKSAILGLYGFAKRPQRTRAR